ncbi:hypothetical protein VTN00DRAFT_83 [Thermoascus crustaceus]|uniref:uncharacterized protein n=1 Tax=Thermoascus crustaceus TaxID=5088 RepID=UPI0037428411
MFAVPGWSVPSSALKQQTEPAPDSKKPAQSSAGDAVSPRPESGSKSKKRKRGYGSDRSSNVTKANLDEMFRRHIEGRDVGQGGAMSSKKDKKRRRKNKQQQDSSTNGVESKETASGEQPSGKDQPGDDKGHKNKKRKKNQNNNDQNRQQSNDTPNGASQEASAATTELLPPPPPPAAEAKLTPLQQSMRQKLLGARFRHLNETLYTTPSDKAFELFTSNPELFNEYHAGFSRQVKDTWPSNPVDGYIQTIRTRGAVAPVSKKQQKADGSRPSIPPLPRRQHGGLCTIADLGCGDAALANALTPSAKKLNLKLLSYDLHSPNALVTKADIANLPLEAGSVDVAIFCLSLMGTNWISFVEEAWRVLRDKGECWVAEKPLTKAEKKKLNKKKRKAGADDAGSDVDDETEIFAEDARYNGNADGEDTDISAFVEVFRTRGFILKQESVDKSNKMFVKMEFVKVGTPTKGKHASAAAAGGGGKKLKFIDKPDENGLTPEEEAKVLKPCVYKTR